MSNCHGIWRFGVQPSMCQMFCCLFYSFLLNIQLLKTHFKVYLLSPLLSTSGKSSTNKKTKQQQQQQQKQDTFINIASHETV